MALAAYPSRPAKNEADWYQKREAYDEAVESNIEEAHTVATNALADDDKAGLNKLGWAPAVFIAKGAPVPTGLPPYTLVVEDL